jgi:hypothetical protein
VNSSAPIRVVQWTTGNIARQAIKAILDRPNMQLVGLYAYSKEKAGKDVGELAQLGRDIGVKATNDIDELIALKPDVVVYMPLHPNIEHMIQLLRAGINIATTASFMTGYGYGTEARKKLQEAAIEGGVSLFGSGVNPGWIDSVVSTASSISREVNLVRVTESFNIGTWAADANQDALGWGRPANDPGHAKDIQQATLPFGDAVEAVSNLFHFKLDDIRCDVRFAHATTDVEVPGRNVKKGSVAGILAQWKGISAGKTVIELNVQWSVSDDIEPHWAIAMAYQVEIIGTPTVKFRAEVLPEDMNVPMQQLLDHGSMITAMPVVNALPSVVAAPPGIVGYHEMKPITSVMRAAVKALPEFEPALIIEEEISAVADSSAVSLTTLAGTWNVLIKSPGGGQETQLQLRYENGHATGEQSAGGQVAPVSDIVLDGNKLSWVNVVDKPIKMKVRFEGRVEGQRISGTCKPGLMGRFAFTAVKVDGGAPALSTPPAPSQKPAENGGKSRVASLLDRWFR